MKLKLMTLDSSRAYAEQVAAHLDVELSEVEEFCFDDGECFAAPKENIRGADVFILQSLYDCERESLSRKIVKSLILCGSAATASSGRTTFVAPYLCFARQDRKTSSRAPITTKYVQRFLQSMRVDRTLSIDVHNPAAEQNAFALDIHLDLLDSRVLYHEFFLDRGWDRRPLTLLSPDPGGLERVTKLYKGMRRHGFRDVEVACMYKTHGSEGQANEREIAGHGIMGDVRNRDVIVYDDMISSGKTVKECAIQARESKAKTILAVCAPHGLFVGKANEYLDDDFINQIVVTDTVPPFRLKNPHVRKKLTVLPTTKLFADAIRNIHSNESISALIAGKFPI